MLTYILLSFCLFFSLLNLIFTLLLSNSVYRLLSPVKNKKEKNDDNAGLVDLKPTVTYDPRFRN